MPDLDRLSAYDYPLPEDLIAHLPADRRDASRLMTLDRDSGAIGHRRFTELPDLLQPGDLLVLNDTRVLPAKLVGVRESTGGRWEGLFLGLDAEGRWDLIAKTRGSIQPGETIAIAAAGEPAPLRLELAARTQTGGWRMKPLAPGTHLELLARFGQMPLPPYIERADPSELDRERYQTTYSRVPGAVAAPTAGLHFTPEVFDRCDARGIGHTFVTLHVGIGTFRPVSVENLADHQMHSEWGAVPQDTVDAIRDTKERGGRVIAVGTTSVRTLESAAGEGELQAWSGETSIFIRPPYAFRVIDGLVTNFHLPKSTLLMLVSALAGREAMLRAYQVAIEERYRFFSYGDAMLITGAP
ncbi:S-adenosylmethionine:tRNA ribosyltransferase-isomerase [Caulifigura coniformis]|uniref:S-adenosylmethionine:tRNA ribosyltransferase-isomerase n=1 Tax=Caulifigura coniformis TaxID=2527983 RepID=A0A517SBR3_9PLAN|nr:tRNA preQ1(34) S-adenosylmethionine ribosyltransferase-isomerase QueA [Caulifigura coniformis]QDT53569.1 S-adenosylmethionine:tRNA ribosyltransferase-isomerase [Caulifigura coniformis]